MNGFFAIVSVDFGELSKAILFAKVELIGVLIAVIFIVIPVLGQILSKLKTPPPKGPVRPVKPDRPAGQGSVQNEIEEFLRRANQKKVTPLEKRPQQLPARAKMAEKPPQAQIVRAEVVRERAVGGKVEKHVKQYLNKEEFERRSKQLGEDVAEADEKVERHLKSVFDHSLSKIAATPGETASPSDAKLADTAPEITFATPSVAAGDVAALFGNPTSIRQAIILSEILNRPMERWNRESSFDQTAWDQK